MQEVLKRTRESVSREVIERRHKRDSENRVIINMSIKDDSDFLSVFSESSNPVISSDVAEFLEHSTETVPLNELLTLRIFSNCIDDHEKITYKAAIKEYYTEKYIINDRELQRNRTIAVWLGIAGIVVLALSVIMGCFTVGNVWPEVIDIVAWVLLWEAVDISLLESRVLKAKRLRYLSYLSMNVEYFPATHE